jgi:hypothetical protein
VQSYGIGKLTEAKAQIATALKIRRKLYPEERIKDGHPDLATSLDNMGAVLVALGEPGKALTYSSKHWPCGRSCTPRNASGTVIPTW